MTIPQKNVLSENYDNMVLEEKITIMEVKEIDTNISEGVETAFTFLEFLATYLPQEQLKSEWIAKIANRFCEAVILSLRHCPKTSASEKYTLPFEYAPLCHGIRGLQIYCKKMKIDLI